MERQQPILSEPAGRVYRL